MLRICNSINVSCSKLSCKNSVGAKIYEEFSASFIIHCYVLYTNDAFDFVTETYQLIWFSLYSCRASFVQILKA